MSKVTAGINRINQELDKISGMDGIAADKIAELETYVKEMVSDLLEYHSEANVFNYDGNNCCKEKSVKELDKQIQKEHCIINHLYAQINAYERSLERLKMNGKQPSREKTKRTLTNGLIFVSEFPISKKHGLNLFILFLTKMEIL